jgi:REP element-mobilizing transposase RayT
MSLPLAYHLTWTTYGTWLQGDERGWVKKGTSGIQEPDSRCQEHCQQLLKTLPVTLDPQQRLLVQATIEAHCHHRGWKLHAVNVRSNHVHIVVTAAMEPDSVMGQFKAWCSRRLNEHERGLRRSSDPSLALGAKRWWTHGGWKKRVDDEDYLLNAIRYVVELQ